MIDPRQTSPMQSQVQAMATRGAEPSSQPLEQP
jgi:nitrilase